LIALLLFDKSTRGEKLEALKLEH